MIRCVGGIVRDRSGRLLLVQRGNPPGRGRWAVPGGKVEPGETDPAAVIREVREETGLDVEPGELVGTVVLDPFEIHDYACSVRGGTLRAGDDAAAAAWVDAAQFAAMDRAGELVDLLADTLRGWHVAPGQGREA
jgi:8-oxo-dGTP diphosphatase